MGFNILTADGEVLEAKGIGWMGKAKTSKRFSMMFDEGWVQLAISDLKGFDYKVMFLLMSKLSWENGVLAETGEIAEALGVTPPAVSMSIKRLLDAGIFLDTGEKIGKTRILHLHTGIGWKGAITGLTKKTTYKDVVLQAKEKSATV